MKKKKGTTTSYKKVESSLSALNVYQKRIFSFFKENHPYLFDDPAELIEIISNKADDADKVYQLAIEGGKNPVEAEELANIVLHQDYVFSPTIFLKVLVEKTFNLILDEKEVIKVYRKLEKLFQKYDITDDFIGSDIEHKLTGEIVRKLKLMGYGG